MPVQGDGVGGALLKEAAQERARLIVVINDAHWPSRAARPARATSSPSRPARRPAGLLQAPELLVQQPLGRAPAQHGACSALDALQNFERPHADHGTWPKQTPPGASSRARRATSCSWSGSSRVGPNTPPTVEAACSPPASRPRRRPARAPQHASVRVQAFHEPSALAPHRCAPPTDHASPAPARPARSVTTQQGHVPVSPHALIPARHRLRGSRRRARLHGALARSLLEHPPEEQIISTAASSGPRCPPELRLGVDGGFAAKAGTNGSGTSPRAPASRQPRAPARPCTAPAAPRRSLLKRSGRAARRSTSRRRALAEAIERARAADDPAAEARARRSSTSSSACTPIQSTGTISAPPRPRRRTLRMPHDDLDLCRAWPLRASIAWTESRATTTDAAWPETAEHWRTAPTTNVGGSRSSARPPPAAAFGPLPVAEPIPAYERITEKITLPVAVPQHAAPPRAAARA